MLPFFKTKALRESLRKRIVSQLDIQVKFWENFISSDADMAFLVDMANQREVRKKQVISFWKKIRSFKNEQQATTLFIYGTYHSLVNNDVTEGQRLMEQYFEISKQLNYMVDLSKLTNDTLFHSENVEIKISGVKSRLSKI